MTAHYNIKTTEMPESLYQDFMLLTCFFGWCYSLQRINNRNETSSFTTSLLCSRRFVVHGLTTGETYVFRVQAINELGLSDESQESAPLSVRAALSKFASHDPISFTFLQETSYNLFWTFSKHTQKLFLSGWCLLLIAHGVVNDKK